VRPAAVTLIALLAMLAGGCGDGEGEGDAGEDLPVVLDYRRSLVVGLTHPTGPPPGADDRTCRPPPQHPRPVVLVHGTFNNRASTWNALSPLLKNMGYCVFSLNYGGRGSRNPIQATESIDTSAGQLAVFVDDVRRTTGVGKVDIVGYSQGGMMPRQYMKFHGGADKVNALIALAPSNRGTNGDLRVYADTIAAKAGRLRSVRASLVRRAYRLLDRACKACEDQLAGSRFMKRLNDPYDTLTNVHYTVISSIHDQVVTPYRSQFLPPGDHVRNIRLQDGCPQDMGDHLSMPFDSVALHYVTNALDPAHASAPACVRVRAGIGG